MEVFSIHNVVVFRLAGILLLTVLCCFMGYAAGVKDDAATKDEVVQSLKQLHIIYRHGDRTPISLYPNDPNKPSIWKDGLGELTERGCMEHYQLGGFLRKRYEGFITGDPYEISVRSSDRNRCLKSASCHLAAMYVPNTDWRWNKNLPWQPIPIHTRPVNEDSELVPGDSLCPNAEKEYENVKNSQEAQAFLQKYHNHYKTWTEKSGGVVNDWKTAGWLFDTMFIEKLYNHTVPDWANSSWNDLSFQNDQSFVFSSKTPLLQKFRSGVLLKEISDHMDVVARNVSTLGRFKIFMYSTHDTEVSSLLQALKVFNGKAPPYCSTVLIELHQVDSKFYVDVYYLNYFNMTPQILTLPGCNESCDLGIFVELVKPYFITDWNAECGITLYDWFVNHAFPIVIFLGTFLLVLVLSMILYCVCTRKAVSRGSVVYSPLPTESMLN